MDTRRAGGAEHREIVEQTAHAMPIIAEAEKIIVREGANNDQWEDNGEGGGMEEEGRRR